ncbi:MAG: hypothetical protein OXN89_04575 [Bryobacterales bacterium]|nr:hypothetical protein [Bryobacterales bacterium]
MLHRKPCLLPIAVWTASDRARRRAREALHLPAYRGKVTGSEGHWSLAVDDRTVFSATVASGASRVGPATQTGPWATFRHQISPDWTADRLIPGDAGLWSLTAEDAEPPVAIDADSVRIGGTLDGWLDRFGAAGPASVAQITLFPQASPRFSRDVEAPALEPIALRNYLGAPPPEVAAADFPSPARARAALGAQRELVRPDILIAYVDCVPTSDSAPALVPPPCTADPSGAVRVMAIRGLRDPSLDEAWLFARCAAEERVAWYAVSHLAQSLRGAEFGREVLGYPTKAGTAHAMLGGNRFLCSVGRAEATLFEAHGTYGGFSTGTSIDEMTVATLRPNTAAPESPPRGEILLQMWYFQGLRRPVSLRSVAASFSPPTRGAASEIWNALGPVRPYYASILDGGVMQRLPARVLAEAGGIDEYYRDRCDGTLPWEETGAAGLSSA